MTDLANAHASANAAAASASGPRRAALTTLARWRQKWAVGTGRQPTTAEAVELRQDRIYLLPTGRGLFMIATAVLLLLVGINYQLSLAYVVAFLLAGLMQAALLASYRNLRGLQVQAGRSPQTRPGEMLSFPLTLRSPERDRSGLRLTARLLDEPVTLGPMRADADAATPAALSVALPATAGIRGIVPLGRVTIESRAPYGLVRAWSYVHFEWAGLIEPALERPAPPLPLTAGDDDGQRATRAPEVAHDPDSLREYVAGDSLKRVAWKQLAKSGRWYTRTGDSGARQEIELNWNAATLSDSEARLARLAAWVNRADNEGAAYTLTLPNGHLEMADGAQQFADAMRLLAVYPKRLDDVRGLR